MWRKDIGTNTFIMTQNSPTIVKKIEKKVVQGVTFQNVWRMFYTFFIPKIKARKDRCRYEFEAVVFLQGFAGQVGRSFHCKLEQQITSGVKEFLVNY